MCGFCGFVDARAAGSPDESAARVRRMADQLAHRGPDDEGVWVDAEAGVALGHRRLAIVDLSAEGHQPMLSSCGRYVLAYNGEIYNFREIRAALDAEQAEPRWRGHSDTEVMLAAIRHWGLREALERFNGMFAFALWDRRERLLHLARDRFGEKPLYYGWVDGALLFGSELKALQVHPRWRGEIDRGALALLLRHNYIPAPYSIFAGIRKLPPATLLSLQVSADGAADTARPEPYWSVREVARRGVQAPRQGDERERLEELDQALRRAVAMRMVADVPLGAFLSGGIDSSTVVALMQAQSARPVRTFSIGFHEQGYNEAPQAKAVAEHLGTDHTELYVTSQEAMAVIPDLPRMYDEPFADSSQIPTFLVSRLAREQVTVSLSGDGGDELFGGYNRYFWGRRIWRRIGWMPRALRGRLGAALRLLPPERWDTLFARLARVLPASLRQRTPGDKLHKLADILAVDSPESMYQGLVSHWDRPAAMVGIEAEPATALTALDRELLPDFVERMMLLDLLSYLPDDILAKVDRASMRVSLESRVPLLDHEVAELAWQLPLGMKIRGGQGKWALRQVLYRYVPAALIERPKMGFGIPIDQWLRGDLRDWAEALLAEERLRCEGYFDPAPIRRKWEEHLGGRRNWQYHLWNVLIFQAWLQEQSERVATPGQVAEAG